MRAILLAAGLCLVAGCGNATAEPASGPTVSATTTTTVTEQPAAVTTTVTATPTVTITATVTKPPPRTVIDGDGTWIVGIDIKPGTYKSRGRRGLLLGAAVRVQRRVR